MTNRLLSRALATTLLMSFAGAAGAQSDGSGDTKSSLSAADTVFIDNAAKDGMAEIKISQTAVNQSSDDKVKTLAQRIVDDHTKANDALRALAESKQASFPSEPAKDALKENSRLQAMKGGSSFDQAWSKDMVKNHQDAIKMFTKEGAQTKDPDIQQFVKSQLPVLKSHLQAAQQLAAVPDARDRAMDQAAKSMNSAMDDVPAAASTVATPAAKAPTTPSSPAIPATAGAKH